MLTLFQTQVEREVNLNEALSPIFPPPIADIVVGYTSDIFDRCMPTLNYFMTFRFFDKDRLQYLDEKGRFIAIANARKIVAELDDENIVSRTQNMGLIKLERDPQEQLDIHNRIACFVIMENGLIKFNLNNSARQRNVIKMILLKSSAFALHNFNNTTLNPVQHEYQSDQQPQALTNVMPLYLENGRIRFDRRLLNIK